MDLAKHKEKLLDGKAMSLLIQEEIKAETETLWEQCSLKPGLGVVLVGNRPDSATYVRMKARAAEKLGFSFFLKSYPEDISEEELKKEVTLLNEDEAVHGIIVQLPLPQHINERAVTSLVSLAKDVDGFHAHNIGSLALKGVEPLFVPCTPRGVMELLERSGVEVAGKRAVVLGRSNIVGVPMALLLLHANATVTVCHSRTADVEDIVRQADIVVAAIGKAEYVRGEWLKEGAVVVDVGMNRVDDASRKSGSRLTGDVHFPSAAAVASKITPVPGGVGPLTVAMLLKNTLDAAKRVAQN